jgi:hypothetical protein
VVCADVDGPDDGDPDDGADGAWLDGVGAAAEFVPVLQAVPSSEASARPTRPVTRVIFIRE